MRILSVHNRYRYRGGEDVVFEAEAGLLERHGHQVARLTADNAVIPESPSLSGRLRLAGTAVWSRPGVARVREAVQTFRPDVVHFHNTQPLISPAAYSVCREAGAAVVQTLHNYRLICPNAMCFRDGRPCEDCLGRTPPWPGVLHACYRGSRAQSATVAATLTAHRMRGTWERDVDRYIALTGFARRAFGRGGLPEEKLAVKPNFVEPDPGDTRQDGDAMLYVGRLAPEKGIETLLAAWRERALQVPLRIVGDGPLAGLTERAAREHRSIEYLGPLSHDAVLEEMHRARALVVPSIWYETFGLIIIEAYACGLPVIASRLGAMAELVEDGVTGLLFEPGDHRALAATVAEAAGGPDRMRAMGSRARTVYEREYTGARNYELLIAIYEQARRCRTQ